MCIAANNNAGLVLVEFFFFFGLLRWAQLNLKKNCCQKWWQNNGNLGTQAFPTWAWQTVNSSTSNEFWSNAFWAVKTSALNHFRKIQEHSEDSNKQHVELLWGRYSDPTRKIQERCSVDALWWAPGCGPPGHEEKERSELLSLSAFWPFGGHQPRE